MSRYRLLAVEDDSKTSKGTARGVLTGILYLAPATLSGWDVCAHATPGCRAACLNTAGRGSFSNVQTARLRKTRRFFGNRAAFMADLVRDVETLVRAARRRNLRPFVRLNGTSDLPWERVRIAGDARTGTTLMARFPHVQFYDYTKHLARMGAYLRGDAWPPNYALTFSRSEHTAAADLAWLAARGGNIAVVFSTRRGDPLPPTWGGGRVIDGDHSDLRPWDPLGVIIGLRAKGAARHDTSGFVVQV